MRDMLNARIAVRQFKGTPTWYKSSVSFYDGDNKLFTDVSPVKRLFYADAEQDGREMIKDYERENNCKILNAKEHG